MSTLSAYNVVDYLLNSYYPHMPVGNMWIYQSLFVCFLYGYGFLRLGYASR